MLDEPSLGLAPAIVDRSMSCSRSIRADGVTILLVEQNAERAFALADRAYVMSGGAFMLERTAGELRPTPRFRRGLFRHRHGEARRRLIEQIVQTLVDAVSVGGLYALTALGIGLIFGVMRLINFAHGELIMVGRLCAARPLRRSRLRSWRSSRPSSRPWCWRSSTERVAFRPLRNADPATLLDLLFRGELLPAEDADPARRLAAEGHRFPARARPPGRYRSACACRALQIVTIVVSAVLLAGTDAGS